MLTRLPVPVPLDDAALEFVRSRLIEVEASTARGLSLPKSFGGHLVRADAHADLLYLCALLIASGVDEIAGVNLRRRALDLLMDLRADEIEGFYAYRVAEAVGLLGGVSALGPKAQQHAIAVTASPRLLHDISVGTGSEHPNFIVVAARCVDARQRLGLRDDPSLTANVVDRARALFETATMGWINDGGPGKVHFDIYTPEMYLLAEPLCDAIGPSWHKGLQRVMSDLEVMAQPDGIIGWGRSVGALAIAMSVELSVLADVHALEVDRDWWFTVSAAGIRDLEGWFHLGVVNAHQSRACDYYRGPARRLQLTFDLLGKLAWCALRLREAGRPSWAGRLRRPANVDELIRLPDGAAAWAHRSSGLAFVLPLMAGTTPAYLPSPRAEGLFEQPVTGFPLLVPTITTALEGTAERHYVPSGPPTQIEHQPGVLKVRQDGWTPLLGPPSDVLPGGRHAEYRVTGRALDVTEHLAIPALPAGSVLSLAVGQVPGGQLSFACDVGEDPTTVETAGIPEWQTHWSEVQRVHQTAISLDGPAQLRFRWSVTRPLQVATTEPAHEYSRSLYERMPHISVVPSGAPDDDLWRRLRRTDVLHLAWPERWTGMDLERTRHAIEQIEATDTRVVWTQHNLLPHNDRSTNAQRVYSLWAEAADAVIHHSTYGKLRALECYRYPRAQHFVIPHGHWGPLFPSPRPSRPEVERDEGWPMASIRLAIVGRPGPDKQLQVALDAVHRSSRDDLQLVARVSADTRLPDDSRIVPNYGPVERWRYYRCLSAVDGVILPFTGETMLTTGTAFDAIGGGVAVIASPWGFLEETFGSAALWYDGTEQGLVDLVASLTTDDLRSHGAASEALQADHDWSTIAQQTAAAYQQVASD